MFDPSLQLTALILRLAGVPQRRIGPMPDQQICAFLVVENTAEPVALAVGREKRRHPSLADCVYVHTEVDQLREQGVPPAIRRAEQSVLTERRFAFRVEAEAQKKV